MSTHFLYVAFTPLRAPPRAEQLENGWTWWTEWSFSQLFPRENLSTHFRLWLDTAPKTHNPARRRPSGALQNMNKQTESYPELTPLQELNLLTQITAGLLASGHFTRAYDENDTSSQVFSERFEYEADGQTKIEYAPAVVDAASYLLHKLRQTVQQRIEA